MSDTDVFIPLRGFSNRAFKYMFGSIMGYVQFGPTPPLHWDLASGLALVWLAGFMFGVYHLIQKHRLIPAGRVKNRLVLADYGIPLILLLASFLVPVGLYGARLAMLVVDYAILIVYVSITLHLINHDKLVAPQS